MVLSPQTVNVLRYSALSSGIFYGLYHQSKITAQTKVRRTEAEYHRKEALIVQAKAEWAKAHVSKEKTTAAGDLISDPNDSKFDLEAYLQQLATDDQKARA